jgi:hypothetical protein
MFQHVMVSNALTGIFTAGAGATLSHLTLDTNQVDLRVAAPATLSDIVAQNADLYGILVDNTSADIDGVDAFNNKFAGVDFAEGSHGTLTNGVFSGNANAIFVSDLNLVEHVAISNVTLDQNGYGVVVQGGKPIVDLQNAIITNSTHLGVAASQTSLNLTFSDVFGNPPSTYVPGSTVISVDPKYAGAPTNLQLSVGSPCIDTGVAMGAPDHDRIGNPRPIDGDGLNGPQFDMGAYEFNPTATSSSSTSSASTGTSAMNGTGGSTGSGVSSVGSGTTGAGQGTSTGTGGSSGRRIQGRKRLQLPHGA